METVEERTVRAAKRRFVVESYAKVMDAVDATRRLYHIYKAWKKANLVSVSFVNTALIFTIAYSRDAKRIAEDDLAREKYAHHKHIADAMELNKGFILFKTGDWSGSVTYMDPTTLRLYENPSERENVRAMVEFVLSVTRNILNGSFVFHQVTHDDLNWEPWMIDRNVGRFKEDHPDEESPIQIQPSDIYRENQLDKFKFISVDAFDKDFKVNALRLVDVLNMYADRARSLTKLRKRVKRYFFSEDAVTPAGIDYIVARMCAECEYYADMNLLDVKFITGSVEKERAVHKPLLKLLYKKLVKEDEDREAEIAEQEQDVELDDHAKDVDDDEDPWNSDEDEEEELQQDFIASDPPNEVEEEEPDSESDPVETAHTISPQILQDEHKSTPWKNFFHIMRLHGVDFEHEFVAFNGSSQKCLAKYASLWYNGAPLEASYRGLRDFREENHDEFVRATEHYTMHHENAQLQSTRPEYCLFRGHLWAYAAMIDARDLQYWRAPECRNESAFHLFRIFQLKYRMGAYGIDHLPGILLPNNRDVEFLVKAVFFTGYEQILQEGVPFLNNRPGLLFAEQCWLTLPEALQENWRALARYFDTVIVSELYRDKVMWWGNPDSEPYPYYYTGYDLSGRVIRAMGEYLDAILDDAIVRDIQVKLGMEVKVQMDILDVPANTLHFYLPIEYRAELGTMVNACKYLYEVTWWLQEAQHSTLNGHLLALERTMPFCSGDLAACRALFAPVDALCGLTARGITRDDWVYKLCASDVPLDTRTDARHHMLNKVHAHRQEFGVSVLTLAVAHLIGASLVIGWKGDELPELEEVGLRDPTLFNPTPKDITGDLKRKDPDADDDDTERPTKKTRYEMIRAFRARLLKATVTHLK